MKINAWHRPHIAVQHLRQVLMVVLFLQPFRTAQLRRFRETLHPLGRSTWRVATTFDFRVDEISSASVCMKSHRLIFLLVSLLKSIQTFTPARSRMLHYPVLDREGRKCLQSHLEWRNASQVASTTKSLHKMWCEIGKETLLDRIEPYNTELNNYVSC